MTNQIWGVIHNEPLPHGHPNWESSADVLVQAEAIRAALDELGINSVQLGFSADLEQTVKRLRQAGITAAINLCETVDELPELAGHPAAVLELLSVPFSGSSSAALMKTTDKYLVKLVLAGAGISTPRACIYEGIELLDPLNLRFPVILKPQYQEASIGIDQDSVVTSEDRLGEKLELFYQNYGPILVEEFIAGKEFNISVMGYPEPACLPIAEIDFSGLPQELFKIVGYQAKWNPQSIEYHETRRIFPTLPDTLQGDLQNTALRCFQLLGLRDYGRIDVRVDTHNVVHVLEINANPCLSPDAGFTAATARSGLSYREMVRRLVDFTEKRQL